MSAITVTFCTSDYRGDHAADVSVAVAANPDETVAELVKRVQLTNPMDRLEIRIVREDPKPVDLSADPWAS